MISSIVANSANTSSGVAHVSVVASESASGKNSAIHAPMYGTKRKIVASIPHKKALGIPMMNNPMHTGTPKHTLMMTCIVR